MIPKFARLEFERFTKPSKYGFFKFINTDDFIISVSFNFT